MRRVDGHVRDRQRDEPDHDRLLRGRCRCTPHGGRHAGGPDRRGALAHVAEERLGDRRARRDAHARRVGCRSQLDGDARATARSHAAVDLLLDERDERARSRAPGCRLGSSCPPSPRPARRQPRLAQPRRRPRPRRRRGSRRPRPRPRRHSSRCRRTSWRSSRRSERAGAGEPRVRRALERPRAAVRRRALGPLADDLDDRDERARQSSRLRSPRSAMRWTASEPRSPITPIG